MFLWKYPLDVKLSFFLVIKLFIAFSYAFYSILIYLKSCFPFGSYHWSSIILSGFHIQIFTFIADFVSFFFFNMCDSVIYGFKDFKHSHLKSFSGAYYFQYIWSGGSSAHGRFVDYCYSCWFFLSVLKFLLVSSFRVGYFCLLVLFSSLSFSLDSVSSHSFIVAPIPRILRFLVHPLILGS